jgi:hypothetical protein
LGLGLLAGWFVVLDFSGTSLLPAVFGVAQDARQIRQAESSIGLTNFMRVFCVEDNQMCQKETAIQKFSTERSLDEVESETLGA